MSEPYDEDATSVSFTSASGAHHEEPVEHHHQHHHHSKPQAKQDAPPPEEAPAAAAILESAAVVATAAPEVTKSEATFPDSAAPEATAQALVAESVVPSMREVGVGSEDADEEKEEKGGDLKASQQSGIVGGTDLQTAAALAQGAEAVKLLQILAQGVSLAAAIPRGPGAAVDAATQTHMLHEHEHDPSDELSISMAESDHGREHHVFASSAVLPVDDEGKADPMDEHPVADPTWLSSTGGMGIFVIALLVLGLLIALLNIALHTDGFTMAAINNFGSLSQVGVSAGTFIFVLLFSMLIIARALYFIIKMTCLWHWTLYERMQLEPYDESEHALTVCRKDAAPLSHVFWHMFGVGGRHFLSFEAARLALDAISQTIAIGDYAVTGAPVSALVVLTLAFVGNGLLGILMSLPQWERELHLLVLAGVAVDLVFAFFPILYMFTEMVPLQDSWRIKEISSPTFTAISLPIMENGLLGSSYSTGIVVAKFFTRLLPVYWIVERSYRVFLLKTQIKIRDEAKKEQRRSSSQTFVNPAGPDAKNPRQGRENDGAQGARCQACCASFVQLMPKLCMWATATYIFIIATFLFIRIPRTNVTCPVAKEEWWAKQCLRTSLPLFDLGSSGCPCATFVGKSHLCSSPAQMQSIKNVLLSSPKAGPLTTTLLLDQCSVVSADVQAIFNNMANLRSLRIAYSARPKNGLDSTCATRQCNFTDIGQMKSLAMLDLTNFYDLNPIPKELWTLPKLVWLNMAGGSLTGLSSEIGSLPAIEYLGLPNNQLHALPESIGRLTNLVDMWAETNQIGEIPVSFKSLERLKRASFANNRIARLPSVAATWDSLLYLNVEGNRIESFPTDSRRRRLEGNGNTSTGNSTTSSNSSSVGSGSGSAPAPGVAPAPATAASPAAAAASPSPARPFAPAPAPALAPAPAAQAASGNSVSGWADLRAPSKTPAMIRAGFNPACEKDGAKLPALLTRIGWRLECSTGTKEPFKPSCSPGCVDVAYEARGVHTWLGNRWCQDVCNTEACQYDGGDCS